MHKLSTLFRRSAVMSAICGVFVSGTAMAADAPAFVIDSIDGNVSGNYYPSGPYGQVVRDAAGDYVVLFYRSTADSNSNTFIRAYSADGTPKGNEVAIGSKAIYDATIAMSNNGSFSVAWSDYTNDSSTNNIVIQRFSSSAAPQGSLIKVGKDPTVFGWFTSTISTGPRIAMDDDGDIAVAWSQEAQWFSSPYGGYYFHNVTDSSKTYAAIYKADGSVLKAKKVVDTVYGKKYPNDDKHGNEDMVRSLSMYGSGNLIMSFYEARDTSSLSAVRLFGPGLSSPSALITLSDVGGYHGLGADSSGNFDVAWTGADGTLNVSRYNSSASLLGNVGPIETPTTPYAGNQSPTISVAPAGDFAVTWGSTTKISFFDGSLWDTYIKNGQFFHADGSANGAPFIIDNNLSNLTDENLAAAIDGHGNLISIWNTLLSDQSTYAILGRNNSAP